MFHPWEVIMNDPKQSRNLRCRYIEVARPHERRNEGIVRVITGAKRAIGSGEAGKR
ncbi:protein of unknown function [Paenibacillus alvei]|uniref:Uncharacterized protein n=1 Tax=Paenibacillus alvei TaxID=44250 RepID=A0A383R8D1_PAEAL|nr:protein of unknown function [Paenibacillus alvei]